MKKLPSGGGISKGMAAVEDMGQHLRDVVKPKVKLGGWRKVSRCGPSSPSITNPNLEHNATFIENNARPRASHSSSPLSQVSQADRNMVEELWDMGANDGDAEVSPFPHYDCPRICSSAQLRPLPPISR